MKSLHTTLFVLSAALLASCAETQPELTGPPNTVLEVPESQKAKDPDFGAKCIQRIKAGLSNPNGAVIDLVGGDYELQAKVTTTNPDNGEKANFEYVCARDKDRAVTAKLVES